MSLSPFHHEVFSPTECHKASGCIIWCAKHKDWHLLADPWGMLLLPTVVHTLPLPGCSMDPMTLVLQHTRVPLSTMRMATVESLSSKFSGKTWFCWEPIAYIPFFYHSVLNPLGVCKSLVGWHWVFFSSKQHFLLLNIQQLELLGH